MRKQVIGYLTVILLTAFVSIVWAAGGTPDVDNDMEKLGMKLYNDKNFSFNGTQSCRNCHHHFAGFADITNHLDPENKVVSTGADGVSKGGRNAPSAAYAGFSPVLMPINGEWIGGMFWDGRADGSTLGDPLAEQALGPPLNPVEMAMPDKAAVIDVIANADYVNLWYKVFGRKSLDDVNAAYDNFGRAIAAYERTAAVTKFTSKYDLAPKTMTDAELRGEALFEAKCAACHTTTAAFGAPAPLFTNYAYANIGVPTNPMVPLEEPDLGLGVTAGDSAQDGKFKVPTLRNIALSAPYSHNGYFATLVEMVDFINDSSGFTPEVNRNLDDRVGGLGMSADNVDDIVAFLSTLTDDY